jgi:hypothetical protein
VNTCECSHLITEHDRSPKGNPGACRAPADDSRGDAWGAGRCDCVLYHPAAG